MMKPFLIALGFLTRIPCPHRPQATPELMARSMAFYPLVGSLIGLLLVGMRWLLRYLFPPPLADALLLAAWVSISGGLHLDGFIDCCDGLLVAKPPEIRLEILRDTAVGAYGILGAIILMLIKYVALTVLLDRSGWAALILAPVLGRWAMVYVTARYPYARSSGVGWLCKEHVSWRELGWATFTVLVIALASGPVLAIAAFVAVGTCAILFARWTMAQIPGLTGDVYGATGELGELVVLLVFIIAERFL